MLIPGGASMALKIKLNEMAYDRKDIKSEARGQFTNMQVQNKSFLKRIQNLSTTHRLKAGGFVMPQMLP